MRLSEYNTILFRICSRLKLYKEKKIIEEDMLQKTFITFHISIVFLEQKYQEHRITKYFELILCLFITEQNKEP